MKKFNFFTRFALLAALSLCSVEGLAWSAEDWSDVRYYASWGDDITITFSPSSYKDRRITSQVTISSKVTLNLRGNAANRYSYAGSAIVVNTGGTLTLTNGTLNGESIYGAPLIVVNSGGTLILDDVDIFDAYSSSSGAAISINAGGTVTMSSGKIYYCYAPNGGAIYNAGTFTMNGGTIGNCGNNSTSYGGCVYNAGTFTMQGSAVIKGGDTSNDTQGGGGVYVKSGGTFNLQGSATIQACYGWGVHNSGTFNMDGGSWVRDCYEGGVFTNGTFNMKGNAYVYACSGGGVLSRGTTTIKGGSSCCWLQQNKGDYGGGLCVEAGETSVESCNIYLNTGDAGSQVACKGGTLNLISANLHAGVSSARGALFVENKTGTSVVNMSGGDVKESTTYSGWPGAGVTVYSGTFNMSGGWIGNNTATGSVGGGIYVISGGYVNISGGEIRSNTATNGGGIYSERPVTISGGKIYSNTASGGGGGVFVQSGTMELSGGEIYSNSAQYGGGVRCAGGTTTLSGTKIYSNRAYGNGDGVQLHGNLTFNMTGGEIYGNYDYNAVQYGGGGILAWENVKLNISGGKIYNNTTSGNGGAIHMGQNSKVTITGGEIYGNKSGGNSSYSGSGTPSGGIFHNSSDTLLIGKTAKVIRNFRSDGTTPSNVYLPKDKIIIIGSKVADKDSTLQAGDSIGITTKNTPTTSSAVAFSNVCAATDSAYFFSDNTIYTTEFDTASKKMIICGYRLYLDPDGATCSTKFVRTIKGQACPSLPTLTKTGMYSPGWYGKKQTAESDTLPTLLQFSGTVDFSKDSTIYAWWKKVFYDYTDNTGGAKMQITKSTVETDDVLYSLEVTEADSRVKTITVFDMSQTTTVEEPSKVIDAIHNSTKATPNTLIYLPEGTAVPADKAENVLVAEVTEKQGGQGYDTTYTCQNFSVTDTVALNIPKAFDAAIATYKRDSSYRWGTICVPYVLRSDDYIQFYTSGKIYSNGTSGSQLLLTKADTVAAGHPAIYQVLDITDNKTKQNILKTDYVKSIVTDTASSGDDSIKISGVFTKLVINDTMANKLDSTHYDIYYYKGNSFYKRTKGQNVTIPALRAYIRIKKDIHPIGGAPSRMHIKDADQTTDIEDVEVSPAETDIDLESAEIYDILGRRLDALQPGINIVNGKKVFVK